MYVFVTLLFYPGITKASKSPLDELKALKDLKDLKDFKEAVTNGKPTNLLKSGQNLLLFYCINRFKLSKLS